MKKAWDVSPSLQTFHARHYGGGDVAKAVSGWPVKIRGFEQWDFFVYADNKNRFRLCEKSTGVSVSVAKTGHKNIKLCVGAGRERLLKMGTESFGNEVKRINAALNGGMLLTPKTRGEE